jgi:hypothetical protein
MVCHLNFEIAGLAVATNLRVPGPTRSTTHILRAIRTAAAIHGAPFPPAAYAIIAQTDRAWQAKTTTLLYCKRNICLAA